MTSCKNVESVYNKNRQNELTTTKNQIKKKEEQNKHYPAPEVTMAINWENQK